MPLFQGLDGSLDVERAPQEQFFVVTSLAGSLSCYQGTYAFGFIDGAPRFVPPPEGWELSEGAACMVTRGLRRFAGQTLALESEQSADGLRWALRVSPWARDHFGRACRVEFTYEPRLQAPDVLEASPFDAPTPCKDELCRALKREAVSAAGAIESDPARAFAAAVANLSAAEKDRFSQWSSARPAPPPELRDHMQIGADNPLGFPVKFDGRLYFAEFFHPYLRVTWPSWRVSLTPESARDAYDFYIDVKPGRFISAHVE